jgi:serine/threonine protein kinase
MPTDPPDPRTTDSVCRYQLPYPLAALYRLAWGTHEASARFGFSLRLAEGVFRFLGLVNLADAAACGAGEKELHEWLKLFRTPGMGKLLGLFRSTAQHLKDRPPFLRESPALLGGDWMAAANAVVGVRNRWTHDEVQVTNKEAKPLLDEVSPHLRTLLVGVQFLSRYRLGTTQGMRDTGQQISYFWYSSRGTEETCDPLHLRGKKTVTDDLVMLLDPESGEALYLAPFFLWGLTQGDRAAHLAWLYELDESGEGRYRHPVQRQDVVRGLPEPADPDGDGVTVDEYLRRRAEWPGRARLDLTPESLGLLRDPAVPPTMQERYKVIGKLGEGGMGTVWEVEDVLLGRRCALKVLHPTFVRSPHAVRRFLREGKVLAQIKHPGVVEVYDVDIGADQVPYLVMALVKGEDLEHHLARAGPKPVAEVVPLMMDVLEALAAIHAAGVVHRDIKPSNLILAEDGVRLVDFGIAAVPDGTRLTQSMDRMGTVNYMAPEQARGEFSPQSDLYSCGRVLFALLAGRPPHSPAEKLTAAATGVSREIEEVYEHATAEKPADRYPSAAAMSLALSAALDLAARPAPPAPPPAPPAGASGGGTVTDPFRRAERHYPLPVARAVCRIPFLREPAGPIRTNAVFDAFETILLYAIGTAAARVGAAAGATTRDTLRDFYRGRASLGRRAQALGFLAEDLAGAGDPRLRSLFRPKKGPNLIEELVEARNRYYHASSTIPVRDDEVLNRILSDLGRLVEAMGFLEGEVLYAVWPEGGMTAVRLMGAQPSGWDQEPLPGPVSGAYLRAGGQVVPLSPWVRPGESPDEVQLFSEMVRNVPGYVTARGERVTVNDPDVVAELRRACFER